MSFMKPRMSGMLPVCAAALLLAATLAPAAGASPFDPSGVLRLVTPPHSQLNANQSSNWLGYNQGSLEQGGKLFTSVASDWTVPAATQHTHGKSESSATWIGIGGGCVDAGCALADATLIQVGTEQDVDSSGHATYSAWWEPVPVPAVTIGNMSIAPGDRVHASVSEAFAGSGLWTITFKDITRNETFSTTVPYASTNSTVEWIEETPLTIDSGGAGQASLPNLTDARFDNATVNGGPAHLTASEELQLVDASNAVIGTPSSPDAEADGFASCAWTTQCAIPTSTTAVTRHVSKRAQPKHKRSKSKRHRHRKHGHRHHR